MFVMILGILIMVASTLLLPWIIIQMPSDYFTQPAHRRSVHSDKKRLFHFVYHIMKNVLGIIIIFVGIAMLILPGEGILTIIIGLMLTDIPHKYQIERNIIKQPMILKSINWLRKKAKQSPLEI